MSANSDFTTPLAPMTALRQLFSSGTCPAASEAKGMLWSGWMLKAGEGHGRWKKRFFVLLPGELRYYPSESSTSPKGAITLKGARGFCCTHHALKVLILTPDRVWVLECQSKLQIQELGAAMKATAPVIQEMQADWMAKLPASKVSRAVIDKWKRRFFVLLDSGDMLYFHDDTLCQLMGHVRLGPAMEVTTPEADATAPSPFLICLAAPPKRYLMALLAREAPGLPRPGQTSAGARHTGWVRDLQLAALGECGSAAGFGDGECTSAKPAGGVAAGGGAGVSGSTSTAAPAAHADAARQRRARRSMYARPGAHSGAQPADAPAAAGKASASAADDTASAAAEGQQPMQRMRSYSDQVGTARDAAAAEAAASQAAGEWLPATTEDGRRYYFHSITREVAWSVPESSPGRRRGSEPQPPGGEAAAHAASAARPKSMTLETSTASVPEGEALERRQARRVERLRQQRERELETQRDIAEFEADILQPVKQWAAGKDLRAMLLTLHVLFPDRCAPGDFLQEDAEATAATLRKAFLRAMHKLGADAGPALRLQAERAFVIMSEALQAMRA